MVCLKRCYEALEIGGRLAVLIGDVRRSGKYTPIVTDVLNFPYGEIRSIIIKVQHNCTSDRKRYGKLEDVPIKHEYCVIFKKPVVQKSWLRYDTATKRESHQMMMAFKTISKLAGLLFFLLCFLLSRFLFCFRLCHFLYLHEKTFLSVARSTSLILCAFWLHVMHLSTKLIRIMKKNYLIS